MQEGDSAQGATACQYAMGELWQHAGDPAHPNVDTLVLPDLSGLQDIIGEMNKPREPSMYTVKTNAQTFQAKENVPVR